MTFLTVESDQRTMPPQPDLSVVINIPVVQTWTYQVDSAEGVYVVKISPEPLTASSGEIINYDIEGKTMHIDVTVKGKSLKIKDLQILKFTRR
jgi:hypothetical protein